MAKKILFVVEGERAETRMLISTFERAMSLSSERYDVCKIKTNIHILYKKMKELGYDSFLTFLYSEKKEIFPDDMFTPETAFASVYLFFDLDPQETLFSIEETTSELRALIFPFAAKSFIKPGWGKAAISGGVPASTWMWISVSNSGLPV